MSKSWTSTKSELKEKKVIRIDDPGAEVGEEGDQEAEKSKNQLSSSSVDPGSSSNANTNSRWVVTIKQSYRQFECLLSVPLPPLTDLS